MPSVPKQLLGYVIIETLIPDAVPTLVTRDAVQPLASVTVTVYEFAVKFERSSVVAKLLHEKVGVLTPPLTTVRSMEPVPIPQNEDETLVENSSICVEGCVIVAVLVAVQPLASIT